MNIYFKPMGSRKRLSNYLEIMPKRLDNYDYIGFAEPLKHEPCIWDISHKFYNLHDYKSRSYCRIGRELRLPGIVSLSNEIYY